MTEIVLLPRYLQQVHTHLVVNYLDLAVRPVILGIFGRPGDGKSAQLMVALERCAVEILRVNAADLESGLAGEPGKLVARTYQAASMAIERNLPTAIVVDDIDTTVGEWEQNTGTVNHQQILAELMHIADRPVDQNRQHPRRVPIFMTGNNLSRLYPPLRRHGRMAVFEWIPTQSEVRQVIDGLFASFAGTATLKLLATEFDGESLAFFADVRNELIEAHLSAQVSRMTFDMRAMIQNADMLRAMVSEGPRTVTGQHLLEVARDLRARRSAASRDFLERSA